MPFGIACHRLRMKILLSLLQECNKDICYQCGKKIKTVKTLSIEHKQPWLDHPENNNDLFWNLNNIAFSHRKCNKPHTHGAIKKRYIGPKGTVWCSKCQIFKKTEYFTKQKNKWSGYHAWCKKCRVKYDNMKRKIERHGAIV